MNIILMGIGCYVVAVLGGMTIRYFIPNETGIVLNFIFTFIFGFIGTTILMVC